MHLECILNACGMDLWNIWKTFNVIGMHVLNAFGMHPDCIWNANKCIWNTF